ncbi:YggT family protein [Marinobacter sp. M3C]|jgi:YggT family protein|uniref:YggT family protein n=1 Tax=unclassified Marinobacter TaxID=83889 RepID=UPI00200E7D44|nr:MULTISPECIES: YggT family protein [unclassified Marinobacter]MCL1476533.1 YggT family protein [Marinobacter sp.]MCL1483688.1 YggT family protein [Marinobacter sp.]MCL1486567.1 YggT family protein [Marinobacter sp.]UQG56663.1 YggT family protein [Marinobacter sp. M4C]UQG62127.1 YggT family protein [Marinobacter sp. M3C]
MLPKILLTILSIASSFYMTLVLLRFLLQLARADFYNPISQFVVKVTNPPLRVVRKVIPGWGGIDGAAIVLTILIQAITFTLVLLLYDAGAALFNPAWLLSWSVLNVAGLVASLYFWAVIAVVVISWIAPGSSHPAIQLVAQITEPVMRPVRKVVPSLGGLDLSPIIVFLILQVITVMIDHMKVATGMPALLAGM